MNIVILHDSNCIKSYGAKPLYIVNLKKNVLDKQIDVINRAFKNPTITIISGFKHKGVKKYVTKWNNVEIIENKTFEENGEIYSLSLILDKIKDSLLLIQNNVIFKHHIFNKFKRNRSQLFLSNNHQFELGCTLNNNLIQNISWSLPNYWTNISYFVETELELLKWICNPIHTPSKNMNKLFLMEGINFIIDHQGKFVANFVKSKIFLLDKPNVS